MPVEVTTTQTTETAHRVAVRGPIDAEDADALEALLSGMLNESGVEVVTDLTGVDTIGPGLIRMLARCARRHEGTGSRLLLAGPSFVGRISSFAPLSRRQS